MLAGLQVMAINVTLSLISCLWVRVLVMVFNATFNNNSIISWQLFLLVE